jgi:mRNA interferase RelE/StbE
MTSKTSYEVFLHREAHKEMKALPKPARQEAKEIIEELRTEPIPTGARKLKGRANAYRIRFGDYRLVYEVNAREVLVFIMGVGHRREVYRRLLRGP